MSRTLSAMGLRSSGRHWWRRAIAVAAVAAVAVGFACPLAVARPAAQEPGAAPSASAAPAKQDSSKQDPTSVDASGRTPAEDNALTQARTTGNPVEVADQITESSTVLANPDGKFTLRSHSTPVRVKKDGAWRAIDTTLTRRADGALVPTATTVDVAFSSGGTTPLVTLTQADKTFSMSWPAALPTPVVTGNTATYPEVLPGVDLRVSANANSYSEILVVHDAQAAKNPALAAIKLPVTTTGMTLETAPDGALTAKDATGKVVFAGGTSIMWDSSHDDQVGPAPTADNAGSGRVSALKVEAKPTSGGSVASSAGPSSAVELTLIPEPAALTGADVRYPVYIDPTMARGQNLWTEVTDVGWSYFNDPNQNAQVGLCDWFAVPSCGRTFKARSYFQFATEPLQARNGRTAVLYSSTFTAFQLHGAHLCTTEPVDLFESGPIDAGTRWGGPANFAIDRRWSNAGDQCGGGANVEFSANKGVEDAIKGNWSSLALALISPDENNGLQWKQFRHDVWLDVKFNFPPNSPVGLRVSNEINCGNRHVTPDAYPTLYASATDNNDPPLELGLWYELWNNTGTSLRARNTYGVNIASGTTGGWPDDVNLGNGDYAFRVTTENHVPAGQGAANLWSGTWSEWYWFTARSIPPSQTPSITSFDYPRDNWGYALNAPGTFTFNANGAPNIIGFTYTFNGSGTEVVPNNLDCDFNKTFGNNGGWVAANGSATVTVPAGLSVGPHTLYVRSIDDGHNLSPESQAYTFYVSPSYAGMPVQRIEAETSGVYSQPAGQNLGLGPQPNCCGVTWSGGNQLLFGADKAGVSFDLTFTTPGEADYALGAGMTKNNDYGKLTFLLDGQPLRNTDITPWDGYDPTFQSSFMSFGGAHLIKGTHVLTFKVVGTNDKSLYAKYQAGVDYLFVVPINNVTTASFTDAMNNKGISTDGTTANLDLWSNGLSAQTLAAAGWSPGSTVTVNGAAFTIPTARADGNDNVVATGQTIPLPINQRVKASAVGLLVTSTCGNTPETTFGINYTDTMVSKPLVPIVPEWATGPAETATLVLPYWNKWDNTTSTSMQPRVYAIFLPADPRKTLESVTLPNIGTNFLPPPAPCTFPALHVLSIAPRPVAGGWVGAWAAPADGAVPPPGGNGFTNTTLRTVIKPSATGATTRVRLSNPYAGKPVTIGAASVAAQTNTNTAATLAAPVPLTFGGATTVTIPAAGEVYSDPVASPATTAGSGNLLVSIHLPNAVSEAPIHASAPGGTYQATGNTTTDATGTPFTTTLPDAYYIAGLDASTSDTTQGTVVVLGDQTSAVGAPGTPYRTSWVDNLPAKLATVGAPVPGGLINASQAGVSPTSTWRLNDGSGTTARDSTGTNNAILAGGVTWSTDRGGAATFDGYTGTVTTAGPVLNTTSSYTVSTWVNLQQTTGTRDIISQDATQQSGFYLQYRNDDNRWSFTHFTTDTTNPAGFRKALSKNPPQVGVWTHLLGTYDAATHTSRLYVNGQLEGTATDVPAFPSTGPLAIGRSKFNGTLVDHFYGSISDARVFQRVATHADAAIIYKGGPGYAPQPGLGTLTTSHTADVLQRAVTSAPQFRSVIMTFGADDILAGTSFTVIKQNIQTLTKSTSALGLRRNLRPDNTPIHILLATVPPLGLDPNDLRETERKRLNDDIEADWANYGTQGLIKLASAVHNPADISKLDPIYLTGGTPNGAYHDKVAQTMADTINRLPGYAGL